VHEAAHKLIADIYAAAMPGGSWQPVTDGFAEIFGGSIIALGLLSDPRDPGPSPGPTRYATGMDPDALTELFPYLLEETPWSNRHMARARDRFRCIAEDFEHLELEGLQLYSEWMKPRGMAPIWPCGHAIVDDEGRTLGGMTVFRRSGQGEFTEAELERASTFIPHLRRAATVHHSLHAVAQEQIALGEAIDRLYTGVLLLDGQRRVVLQNQAASRILADEDGLRVDRSGPSALDAKDNVRLRELIARAIAEEPAPPDVPNVILIKRPSGKRDYTLTVGALLDNPGEASEEDATAVIFVVDPETDLSAPAEVLEDLYDLTHSEAQIVRLIADGLTIEEAAKKRGVSVNTARSHLKRAFAKTGTTRQSELMRLIVAGVGSIGPEER
jgi:DNA-binding CsgD family transcriptional regulator